MSELATFARNTGTGPNYRGVRIATPAAGAGFSVVPDAGRAWEVLAVTAVLASSATSGTRLPTLSLTDGSATFWRIAEGAQIIESETRQVSWIADYTFSLNASVDSVVSTPMPHAILLPGWSLTVTDANIDTTDQYSACRALVIETSTGEREYARTIAGRLGARAEAFADLLTGDV